jgi:hypothetical protein
VLLRTPRLKLFSWMKKATTMAPPFVAASASPLTPTQLVEWASRTEPSRRRRDARDVEGALLGRRGLLPLDPLAGQHDRPAAGGDVAVPRRGRRRRARRQDG